MWDVGDAELVKNEASQLFFSRTTETAGGTTPIDNFSGTNPRPCSHSFQLTIDSLTRLRSMSTVNPIYPIFLTKSMKLF